MIEDQTLKMMNLIQKLMRKEDEEGIEIEQQPHSFVLKIISLIHGRSIIKISLVSMMILALAYNLDTKFVLRHFLKTCLIRVNMKVIFYRYYIF